MDRCLSCIIASSLAFIAGSCIILVILGVRLSCIISLQGLSFQFLLKKLRIPSVITKNISLGPIFIQNISTGSLSVSWKHQSLMISVENLSICLSSTHVKDWKIINLKNSSLLTKHFEANYLTRVIVESSALHMRPSLAFWLHYIDYIIQRLEFKATNIHIRIHDPETEYAFGISIGTCHLQPVPPTPSVSTDSISMETEISNVYFYVNCNDKQHNVSSNVSSADSSQAYDKLLTVDLMTYTLDMPVIFGKLLQPNPLPETRKKLIRVQARIDGVLIRIHEKQMPVFLYSCLRAFGLYEYYPYLAAINAQMRYAQRIPTPQEETQYIALYRNVVSSSLWSTIMKKKLVNELLALEEPFSLLTIMSLRRQAMGWLFQKSSGINETTSRKVSDSNFSGNMMVNASMASSAESPLQQDDLLSYDPALALEQDVLMSAYLHNKRTEYNRTMSCLDEIYLAPWVVTDIKIHFYDEHDDLSPQISVLRHRGTLCNSVHVTQCTILLRYLVCSDNQGNAIGSHSVCEPYIKRFESELRLMDFLVRDEKVKYCEIVNRRGLKSDHRSVDGCTGPEQSYNRYGIFLESRHTSGKIWRKLSPEASKNSELPLRKMESDVRSTLFVDDDKSCNFRIRCCIDSSGCISLDSNADECIVSVSQFRQLLDWLRLIGRTFYYRNMQPDITIPCNLYPIKCTTSTEKTAEHANGSNIQITKHAGGTAVFDQTLDICSYLWLGGRELNYQMSFDNVDLLFLPSISNLGDEKKHLSSDDRQVIVARVDGSFVFVGSSDRQYFTLDVSSLDVRCTCRMESHKQQHRPPDSFYSCRWSNVLYPSNWQCQYQQSCDLFALKDFYLKYSTGCCDTQSDQLECEAADNLTRRIWNADVKRLCVSVGEFTLDNPHHVLDYPVLLIELGNGETLTTKGRVLSTGKVINFDCSFQKVVAKGSIEGQDLLKMTLLQKRIGEHIVVCTADMSSIRCTGDWQCVLLCDTPLGGVGTLSFRVQTTEPILQLQLSRIHSLTDDDSFMSESSLASVVLSLSAPLPQAVDTTPYSSLSSKYRTVEQFPEVHNKTAYQFPMPSHWRRNTSSLAVSHLIAIDEYFLLPVLPAESASSSSSSSPTVITVQLCSDDASNELIGTGEMLFAGVLGAVEEATATLRDVDGTAIAELVYVMQWYSKSSTKDTSTFMPASHEDTSRMELMASKESSFSVTVADTSCGGSEISDLPDCSLLPQSPFHTGGGLEGDFCTAFSPLITKSDDGDMTKLMSSLNLGMSQKECSSHESEESFSGFTDACDLQQHQQQHQRQQTSVTRSITNSLLISIQSVAVTLRKHQIHTLLEVVDTLSRPVNLKHGSVESTSTNSNVQPSAQEAPVKSSPSRVSIGHPRHDYMGKLPVRCGDFGRLHIISKVLERANSLKVMVAQSSPSRSYDLFWSIFSASLGGKAVHEIKNELDYICHSVRELRTFQKQLVLAFQNYSFAVDAWGLIVVPMLCDFPRVGRIRTASNFVYVPMLCPIGRGTSVFVDKKVTILAIKGDIANDVFMAGIRTAAADADVSKKRFLEFEVDRPCVIWIAWDIRCVHTPNWIIKRDFRRTNNQVITTASTHVLFSKDIPRPSKIVLGGCSASGARKQCNYFVLLSKRFPNNVDASMKVEKADMKPNGVINFPSKYAFNNSLANTRTTVLPCWYLKHSTLISTVNSAMPIASFSNSEDSIDSQRLSSFELVDEIEGIHSNDVTKHFQAIHKSLPIRVILKAEFSVTVYSVKLSFLEDYSDVTRLHVDASNISLQLLSLCSPNTSWFTRQHILDVFSSFQIHMKCLPYQYLPAELHPMSGEDIVLENIIHPWSIDVMLRKIGGELPVEFAMSTTESLSVDLSPAAVQAILFIIDELHELQYGYEVGKERQSDTRRVGASSATATINSEIIIENGLGQEVWLDVHGLTRVLLDNDDDTDDLNDSLSDLSLAEFCTSVSSDAGGSALDMDSGDGDTRARLVGIPPLGRVAFQVIQNADISREKELNDILSSVQLGLLSLVDWEDVRGIRIECESTTVYPLIPKSRQDIDSSRIQSTQESSIESLKFSACQTPSRCDCPFGVVVTSQFCRRQEVLTTGGITSKCSLEMGIGTWVSSGVPLRDNKIPPTTPSSTGKSSTGLRSNTKPHSYNYNNGFEDEIVVLVQITSNVNIKNRSNCSVALLETPVNSTTFVDTNRQLAVIEPMKSIHVPISCLHRGQLHLCRLWTLGQIDSEGVVGMDDMSCLSNEDSWQEMHSVSLALNYHAFDFAVSAQLRRSHEYECQSVVLLESKTDRNTMSLNLNMSLKQSTVHAGQLGSNAFEISNHVESDPFLGSKETKVRLWDMVLQPALILTNTLPCSLCVELSQPPLPTHSYDDSNGQTTDGAQDIFFLPQEFYSYSDRSSSGSAISMQAVSVQEADDWEPFNSKSDSNGLSCGPSSQVIVHSGEQYSLPCLQTDRTLYFRISIPGTDLWSYTFVIPKSLHQHRMSFHKHKPEVIQWNYLRTHEHSACRPPVLYLQRSWETLDTRRIDIFTKFWIANKSGLALKYSTDERQTGQNNLFSSQHENPELQPFFIDKTAFLKRISNQHNPLLPAEYCDYDQTQYFNSSAIPIMTDCPHKQLRVLPCSILRITNHTSCSTKSFGEIDLFLYNITTFLSEEEFKITRGLNGFNATLTQSRRVDVIQKDKNAETDIPRNHVELKWPQAFADNNYSLNNIICLSLMESQITKSATSSDSHDLLSFQISCDSHVYICVDSRCIVLPKWLSLLGYRCTGESVERIETGDASEYLTSFQMYQRFYRKNNLVKLGAAKGIGPYHKTDQSEAIAMYFVVVARAPIGTCEPTVDIEYNPQSSGVTQLHYNLVPGYCCGDKLFCDAESRISELPSILRRVPLLALLTANREKGLRGDALLRISLMQPSKLFLCLDGKINLRTLPSWIHNCGFEKTSYVLRGNGEPFSFIIFVASYPSGTINIGGLGGCRSRTNFILLIAHENVFRTQTLATNLSLNVLQQHSNTDNTNTCQLSGEINALCPEMADLNSFWNPKHCGGVVLQKPHFDEIGRHWSVPFHIELGHGDLSVSGCTIAATVQPLSGVFHRTSVLSLVPKFFVVNRTPFILDIWPHMGSQAMLLTVLKGNSGHHLHHHHSNIVRPQCVSIEPTETCILYYFWEHRTLESAEGGKRRFITLNVRHADDSEVEAKSRLSHRMSREICLDDIGERYIWVVLSGNKISNSRSGLSAMTRCILCASVTQDGVSTVVTIHEVSNNAPFRLENRSIGVSLRFRQHGYSACEHSTSGPDEEACGWTDLPPHSWRTFIWLEYDVRPRLLEVAVLGEEDRIVRYALDEVAQKRLPGLQWGSQSQSKATWDRQDESGKNDGGSLGAGVYLDGSVRVLVFFEETQIAPFSVKNLLRGIKAVRDSSPVQISSRRMSSRRDSIFAMQMIPINSQDTGETVVKNYNNSIPLVQILRNIRINITLAGLHMNLIDTDRSSHCYSSRSDLSRSSPSQWEELLAVSVEGFLLTFDGSAASFSLSVFHLQVDDMRDNAKFPVVIVGLDSGLNSHLRSKHHDDSTSVFEDASCHLKGADTQAVTLTPLFQIHCDAPKSTDEILHINALQVTLGEISVKLDVELLMRLVGLVGKMGLESQYVSSTSHAERDASTALASSALMSNHAQKIAKVLRGGHSASVYLEFMYISSIVIQLEIFANPQVMQLDPSSMDEPVAAGFAVLGTPLLSFIGGIVGSIAHISPSFSFNEVHISSYFGSYGTILWLLSKGYIRQAITQGYKVFGSMEILGDPLSFMSGLGAGLMDFLRTTQAEMAGETDTRGQGVRQLANAVVGSTFGSASRMTGSLAQMVKSATGIEANQGMFPTEMQTSTQRVYITPVKGNREEMTHVSIHGEGLSRGLRDGGELFLASVVAGISGLVEEPSRGLQEGTLAGAVKGTCRGVLGLVAAPVAGALGAVAVLAESVEESTKFWNGHQRPVGRRRNARRDRIGSGLNSPTIPAGVLMVLLTPEKLVRISAEERKMSAKEVEDSKGDQESSSRSLDFMSPLFPRV